MPRPRRRVRLEDGLRLDVNRLFRDGRVKADGGTKVVGWEWSRDGQPVAYVPFTVSIDPAGFGHLTAKFGDRVQRIEIASAPRPFGGRQFYACCPISGRRVSVLWKPPGSPVFAGRAAWGRRVAYASQFMTPVDRAWKMKAKISARLAAGRDVGHWELPDKPKRMRWTTYERFVDRYYEREAQIDATLGRSLARFLALG